ncbi:MAG TPA: hypothetical protein VN137_02835 [Sphingomonas sp.]|nr:hypothetical protein [Sphingomonas sp.]
MIDASARLLLDFLERNKGDGRFDYPHSFSYPKNCCESVSLILTYLLEEKYQLDNVRIINGTKPGTAEHHFWVMVGDWNYDLTAHQFRPCKPIIGALADELFLTFEDWEVEQKRDFVDRDEVVALYRSGAIPF